MENTGRVIGKIDFYENYEDNIQPTQRPADQSTEIANIWNKRLVSQVIIGQQVKTWADFRQQSLKYLS